MIESDSLLLKTNQSSELLRRAKKYIEQAENLPDGDDKKAWLEDEASKLIEESRSLSREVKQVAGVIHSKMNAAN